jgi:hypothetical protein
LPPSPVMVTTRQKPGTCGEQVWWAQQIIGSCGFGAALPPSHFGSGKVRPKHAKMQGVPSICTFSRWWWASSLSPLQMLGGAVEALEILSLRLSREGLPHPEVCLQAASQSGRWASGYWRRKPQVCSPSPGALTHLVVPQEHSSPRPALRWCLAGASLYSSKLCH